MSGVLASAAIGLAVNWRTGLQPGSWRGVPFLCRDTSRPAGRRLAEFEFPDSDQNEVQDLGRGIKTYQLAIYVCGDDYMDQRDALEEALDAPGPGTLVHPYKGPLQVYAKYPCLLSEVSEKGRAAFFECKFVEAADSEEQPAAAPDIIAGALDAAAGLFGLLSDAFSDVVAFVIDGLSAVALVATLGILAIVGDAVGTLLIAAGTAALALAQDLQAVLAVYAVDDYDGADSGHDASTYAASLASLVQDYVAGIVTDANAATVPDASAPPGYQDSSRLPPLPPDPSYGLAALAAIGSTMAPGGLTGQAVTNRTALAQLVGGSATAGLMMLYAQTAFTAAADVDAARTQIYELAVAQIEAAAGNDALVAAWRAALSACVAYLTQAAKQVSQIAELTTPVPLPAVVLAQRLYRDGSQAAALVQRNAAPHPLFMPLTVEYLVP